MVKINNFQDIEDIGTRTETESRKRELTMEEKFVESLKAIPQISDFTAISYPPDLASFASPFVPTRVEIEDTIRIYNKIWNTTQID